MMSSAGFPRSWPGSRSGSADVATVYRQLYVDVAPGGVGIRAHLVGSSDDPRRLLMKLAARDRAQLVIAAYDSGLVGTSKPI